MKPLAKRTAREVAIQGAERAIIAAVRMLDPAPIPDEERRLVQHAMEYVHCSGALVEEDSCSA